MRRDTLGRHLPPLRDITGQRFGRLVVLRNAGRKKAKHRRKSGRYVMEPMVLCQCDCGRQKHMMRRSIISKVKSCGCLYAERFPSLVGRRFGRLLVLRDSGKRHKTSGGTLWLCQCDCGKTKLAMSCDLNKGCLKSCGCLYFEMHDAGLINRKHGATSKHATPALRRTYTSWQSMQLRCSNPAFENYYGKVTVCDRWKGEHGFENFLTDMGERPQDCTLDRKNPFNNYEPSNCAWATRDIQALNQKRYYTDGKAPEAVEEWYAAQVPDGAVIESWADDLAARVAAGEAW